MAEPVYFQWQNKFLLETIYLRRNRKLADFLIYCKEIELWEENKGKDIAHLQAEKDAYIADRDQAVITAYKSYKVEYDYFTKGDPGIRYRSKYRLTDEAELLQVRDLHRTLSDNLPKRQDVRKEKNFVAYYVSLWQEKIRRLKEEQARLERRLQVILPDHRERPGLNQQLQKLREITLPIMSEELERLLKFLSTYNKIEKRKLEFYKATEAAKTEIRNLRAKLEGVHTPLRRVEAEYREVSAELKRLQTPPQRDSFEGYFLTDEVSGELRRQFPAADPALIGVVGGIHKRLASELRTLKSEDVRRTRVRDFVHELRGQHNTLVTEAARLESQLRDGAANSGEKQARLNMLREGALRAVETELDKLSNYYTALEHAKKPRVEWDRMIQDRQKELQRKQASKSQLEGQAAELEAQVKAKESILNMSEVDYLVRFLPDQPITVKDIVRGKIEKYKGSLEQKLDKQRPEEEIQQELLEEIVRLFMEKPGDFPLWLQYMVIHFSGMRYATAHGSWADPKDLLKSLRTSALEKDFRRMDDDAVEALCEERLAVYESPNPASAPKLALANDPKSKAKVSTHLKRLERTYNRRDALFELLIDEQGYEIDTLDPAEALKELEARRESFPDWMWKEIVQLTDLRVKEAKDSAWNKLSEEEKEEKNLAKYAELREVMNKWKQAHITGWRQEHDRSNRLIVTSSVCNEVAEQILHLRGHSPGGGLTGLVDWYMRMVREEKTQGVSQRYFVFSQPGAEEYCKIGATILWLRFVHDKPNPWRIAKPLATKQGDRLIPERYRAKTGAEDWTYFEGDGVRRTRQRVLDKKKKVTDEQWLRWMHAATVAKVAETADGPVVLTFETALPYDDPSVSAVGVFKHSLQNLMYDGGEENYFGAFLAYVPEVEMPVRDLEEMLDWNKILRRQVMSPVQLEEYRTKYIRAT
ncbi:MAG TPA: hypothetical protein VK900_21660 [Anaerolineales bacterium]|nr:hypothetical protein [Anaerolineales bacterium]